MTLVDLDKIKKIIPSQGLTNSKEDKKQALVDKVLLKFIEDIIDEDLTAIAALLEVIPAKTLKEYLGDE